MTAWSVKLAHAPLHVITLTLTTAQDSVRAAMLPEH